MTKREYLRMMRAPELHGISARAMLQHYGRTACKRSWRFTCFHLAIAARDPALKHDLFRMARG